MDILSLSFFFYDMTKSSDKDLINISVLCTNMNICQSMKIFPILASCPHAKEIFQNRLLLFLFLNFNSCVQHYKHGTFIIKYAQKSHFWNNKRLGGLTFIPLQFIFRHSICTTIEVFLKSVHLPAQDISEGLHLCQLLSQTVTFLKKQ